MHGEKPCFEKGNFYADITQDGSVETGDKLKLGQYVAEKLDESYLPITGAAV